MVFALGDTLVPTMFTLLARRPAPQVTRVDPAQKM
jgi:hypothetical protein